MMILVGTLMPSGLLIPGEGFSTKVLSLPSTWQVPALLLTALVCGPNAGVIASVAYITIGLFQLPVFHGGGTLDYLFTPGFGFLVGFIPAAWLTGRLANQAGMNNLPRLTLSAVAGLMALQACGVLNLIFGSLMIRWSNPLPELLFTYTIAPLPAQLSLCACVGLIAIPLRKLLLIK